MLSAKILIIDGMNLIRRIYEANPREDSQIKAEGAISSSMQSFKRALRTHNPTHCLWTFDPPGRSTWRHALHEGYKKDRSPMPTVLRNEINALSVRLQDNNWSVIEDPRLESDDTSGSCAVIARSMGMDATVLTTDKDSVVLVDSGAVVYDHFADINRDSAWCQAKFGVSPAQMTDFLALTGDPTDGIPGVPKIGAKTAAKLLNTIGDFQTILDRAAEIPGIAGRNLIEFREQALLSRKLVQLDLDCLKGRIQPKECKIGTLY